MKKLILIIILLTFTKVGNAAELTIKEITNNIEIVLEEIDNVSFKYVVRAISQNIDTSDSRILLESSSWYKKPYMGRHEIIFMFGREKDDVFIYKAEGKSFYEYKILKHKGKVNKTQYPLDKWKYLDINLERVLIKMKKLIEIDTQHFIEYDNELKKYIINFATDNNMTFHIKTDPWLIEKVTSQIGDEISVMTWEDVVINAGISDELFDVPIDNDNNE